MIQLEWPWVLVLLPLPLAAWRLLPVAREEGRSAALRVPFFGMVAADPGGPGARSSRPRLAVAALAWLLLVLAAARPQWLGPPLDLPLAGRDLIVAVDVSESMGVEDMDLGGRAVTRLAVVQRVAGEFIERRVGDRLGLILFGTRAYVQTPLTFDRDTVAHMLADAAIGLAGKKTAIGDAIGLAVKRLDHERGGEPVMILLSDGANTAGAVDPRRAARLAAERGLRIHTVGIGAERMRVRGIFGSRVVNPSAELDEEMLQAVAATTGGRYFRATDTADLEEVYRLIDRLEPIERDRQPYRPLTALYPWPLGAALVLAASLVPWGPLAGLPRREPR